MDGLIVFLAAYLIYAVVLMVVFTWYRIERWREFTAAVFLTGITALILAKLAEAIYFHPRPFVSQNIQPLVPHAADNGFPSEHTVWAMTLTSLLYFYRRRLAVVAFVLTLLVGAGRVWAHVHSWSDILGGLIIGAIAGYAGVKLARLVSGRLSAKPPKARR